MDEFDAFLGRGIMARGFPLAALIDVSAEA